MCILQKIRTLYVYSILHHMCQMVFAYVYSCVSHVSPLFLSLSNTSS